MSIAQAHDVAQHGPTGQARDVVAPTLEPVLRVGRGSLEVKLQSGREPGNYEVAEFFDRSQFLAIDGAVPDVFFRLFDGAGIPVETPFKTPFIFDQDAGRSRVVHPLEQAHALREGRHGVSADALRGEKTMCVESMLCQCCAQWRAMTMCANAVHRNDYVCGVLVVSILFRWRKAIEISHFQRFERQSHLRKFPFAPIAAE